MDALDLIAKQLGDLNKKMDIVVDKNHRLDKRVVRLESKAKYIYTTCAVFLTTMVTYLKTKFFGS